MADPAAGFTVLLRQVAHRLGRRRLLLALLWALAAALLILGILGFLRAGLPSAAPLLKPGWAVGLAALAGTVVLSIQLRRSPVPDLRRAALLTERQFGLHELLSTALDLPDDAEKLQPAEAAAGIPPEFGPALLRRVRRQADEAVAGRKGREVQLPRLPAALLPVLALCALTPLGWRLSPALPAVVAAVPPVIRVEASSAAPATASPAASPDLPAAQTGKAPGPGTQPSVSTSAPASQPGSTAADARLRESRTALGDTTGVKGTLGGRAGGQSQDSPFGSRESAGQAGQNTAQSGEVLAAAPYDPGASQGQAKVQKTGGQTGERQASGGRGLQSDSRERCSASCLTNNDMNRSQAARQRATPTGDESQAGTSDSGGAAAGSTSAVGLGNGQARTLPGERRTATVSGAVAGGARVQVLGLNTAAGGDVSAGSGSGGAWERRAEAPVSGAGAQSGAVQSGAAQSGIQDVVARYFSRGETFR